MAVEFRLLGHVEAYIDDCLVHLGHARQRCVLVTLLVDANRPVSIDQLLDRVWADRPPQRARNALSGYLSRLRGAFAGAEGVRIERRPEGYLIAVPPDSVDLHRFHRLVAEARAARDAETGAALFARALGLWRGEAFATLDTPWLNAVRASIDADRLAAELDRNDIGLAIGRHGELLGELATCAARHPLDERLAGQLMVALYRCGRQADALRNYHAVRTRLADELGTDPGPDLQRLHKQILTADPALTVLRSTPAAPTRAAAPVPRQLPAPPPSFVGRARELAELDGLVSEPDATVLISAFSGTAGVGKTALAVHWAHQVAHRFPGGQLYANLRGFDPHAPAMEPAEALRDFLDALAVPSHQIPASLPAQSALYRSLLAGQRMLVLLDNARDVEQVRPLLPGSAGCVVVVTSRNRLTGLIAGHAARPLTLDLLTPAEAVDLLARRLGRERLRAHCGAVDEIVRRCARLPLALSVVAAHAATHTDRPLVEIAAELGVPHTLDTLADEDPSTDVRSVLSWSYRALKPEAARLFRLLGLHPGPDITGPAAASLAGVPVAKVGPLVSDLVRAHLLTEHSPGRYAFHDLLRTYAGELATKVDSRPERRAARQRMLDHYLHTAHAADRLLNPHRDRIALAAPCAGAVPEAIAGDAEAMSWFGAEYRVLLAATELAAQGGFDTHAWQLPAALASFQGRRGYWPDWVTSQRQGLEAARRLNHAAAQAHAHRGLGRAYVSTNDPDNAIDHLRRARELFESLGERTAEAETYLNIGWTLGRQGRYREAVTPARRALEIYRAAGHPTGQANALAALGWYDIQLGDHRRGIASCERALALYREIGDRQGEAATLDSLGCAHGHLGHHDQAITYYCEAVRLVAQLGDRYNEADVLARLGDTEAAAGRTDAARDAWRRALSILDELGHPTADQVRARLGHLPGSPARRPGDPPPP